MPKFLLVNPFRLPANSRFLHRPVEGPKEVQVVNYKDIAHSLEGIDWDFDPGPVTTHGDWSAANREEFAYVAVDRLKIVRAACETGKYDAIVLLGGAEPGFQDAREIGRSSGVVVTGCAFAQMHIASMLGDRFSVIYDETWREGERIEGGIIRAATFTTGGKTYTGFRFEHDGTAGYYDADGRPLKKAFIRMPIPYARITSGFSSARKHPVLGRVRAHKGVDYGAGSGTPIMAAGDARVSFVGWKGGYGRTVVLDHGKGYTTLYAHMSRFGKYQAGARIKQGAVIGYVGSTGLATGPHLHYEFRVGGVHRNPLKVTMPPPEPLKGDALVAFRAQVAPAMAQIERLEARAGADTRVAAVSVPRSAGKG